MRSSARSAVRCFSLGLLVVAGAELFTGNNLLAMDYMIYRWPPRAREREPVGRTECRPNADGSVTTREGARLRLGA
jgi:hypothetical protein